MKTLEAYICAGTVVKSSVFIGSWVEVEAHVDCLEETVEHAISLETLYPSIPLRLYPIYPNYYTTTLLPTDLLTYYLLPTTYYLLPTTYYLLPTTCYLLPATCYLLPATYYLLPTTYYLLPTTYYLLPTTYYLLPTTCHLHTSTRPLHSQKY